MYRLEFMNFTTVSERVLSKFWKCHQIMRKLLIFDLNELYKFQILLWIDQLQKKLYTNFWLILSVLHDNFHAFFDFIFSYFDLILLAFLNFKLQFWTLVLMNLKHMNLNHSTSASAKSAFFYQHCILSVLTYW